MKIINYFLILMAIWGFSSCEQTEQDVTFTKEFTSIEVPVANTPFNAKTAEISLSDADDSGLSSLIEKAVVKSIEVEVYDVKAEADFTGELKYGDVDDSSLSTLISFLDKPLKIKEGNIQTFDIDQAIAVEIGNLIVEDEAFKVSIEGKASAVTMFSVRLKVLTTITLNPLGQK